MKKRIGIVGWATGENSFGVTKPYLNWLSQFGDVEILLPSAGIKQGLDLLVLPGGADIAPQSYGEVPGYFTGNTDVYKQYFYDTNLKQYIEAGVPVFGICLGFQQLSSYFGAKLEQDYPFEYSSKHRAEFVDELQFEPWVFEEFTVTPNTKTKYMVNSLHHQGVFELPESCKVMARSQDGNIELVKFTDKIYAGQFHPEEINDSLCNQIMWKLLNK